MFHILRKYVLFVQIEYVILDISRVLNEEQLVVKTFNGRSKEQTAIFDVCIEIHSKEQLEKVCKRLLNVPGVEEIERVTY